MHSKQLPRGLTMPPKLPYFKVIPNSAIQEARLSRWLMAPKWTTRKPKLPNDDK